MKRSSCALLLAFSLGTAGCARGAAAPSELAEATVVIYNRAAPDSPGLARFYAARRHIPNDHVIGLDCSTEEEISRQEYDETIAAPLRKIFRQREWWKLRKDGDENAVVTASRIHFVALIRGMPLKIRATAVYQGDQSADNAISSQNEASVDSELSLLGIFSRQISGAATNPYFKNYRPIGELETLPILLVSRLDAPSAAIVRRMIKDAIEAEKTGLWGRAYVDGAAHTEPGLGEGDVWLKTVVKDLRWSGIPVVYDEKPDIFPPGYPMSDCALYYGWYAAGVAGPFTDPGFTFVRGAVAVHIHSFSASTLRYPDANWVGPLLAKGAAASLGNVYEPYLQMTAHLDIFNDRLLHGFTLAESAYMATRGLSWMNVVVGDPLYRPFLAWSQWDAKEKSAQRSVWQIAHEFALKHAGKEEAEYRKLQRETASRADDAPMLEDLGLREKEAGDLEDAVSTLQQARSVYKKRGDLLRVVLEQADTLIQAGKKEQALALVRKVMSLTTEGPATTLLQRVVDQIIPPTPPPTPTPTPSASPL